jgi:hypothetical protein
MIITKAKVQPPILTIVGSAGVGKSTLGALFNAPIFIQTEDSYSLFAEWDEESQPDFFPIIKKARYLNGKPQVSVKAQILEQLRFLITTEHNYKTVVLDSVTTLHKMFEHELCERDQTDNIAEAAGGYQKGYLVLADWHLELFNAFNVLRDRGITVVLLAHTGTQKIKNRPDVDDFTVYSLDMNEKSTPVYVNLSDAVLYVTKKEFVKGKETNNKGQVTKWGKLVQSGQRQIVTSGDGQMGYVHAKNRQNMPAVIDLEHGQNPLIQYFKFFNDLTTTNNKQEA